MNLSQGEHQASSAHPTASASSAPATDSIAKHHETKLLGLSRRPRCHRLQHRSARRAHRCPLRLPFEKADSHFADRLRRRHRDQGAFRSSLRRRARGARDRDAPPDAPERDASANKKDAVRVTVSWTTECRRCPPTSPPPSAPIRCSRRNLWPFPPGRPGKDAA